MAHPLRLLGPLALFAAASPLAAAQGVDCHAVPPSTGAVDPVYAACARPAAGALMIEDPGDTAFGHNNAAFRFVRFRQDVPGTLTNLGPYAPPGFLNAGDFRGDDLAEWFGVDNEGNAIRVDAASGAVTQLGLLGTAWNGATYDYATGRFYALQVLTCAAGSQLFELDFAALTATPIGAVNPAVPCGIGLAAHPATGQLYAYDMLTDVFLAIDKTTGQSTVIGPIGFDANFGQSMDFDNADGTLYMYAFNNATFVAELRTVDLQTGHTTLVGQLGAGLQQIGAGSSETTAAAGCDQDLAATLDDATPAPGQVVTFTVTVDNASPDPAALDLWLDYTGPVTDVHRLGSGTVAGNASITRDVRIRVPTWYPPGSYDVDLIIGAFPLDVCDVVDFTVEVGGVAPLPLAPRGTEGAAALRWSVPSAQSAPPAALEVLDDFFAPPAEASAAAAAAGAPVAASPNPFTWQTQISYEVAAPSEVRLAVYDVLGREVAVLVDARQEAGPHRATFDARGLAAGTYTCRLVVGNDVRTGRATLTR